MERTPSRLTITVSQHPAFIFPYKQEKQGKPGPIMSADASGLQTICERKALFHVDGPEPACGM